MPLPAGVPTNTKKQSPPPQKEILTDPRKCILRNKIWRGDIIPLFPIQRNYFILWDKMFSIDRLMSDLARAESMQHWVDKDLHTHKWKSITLHSYNGEDQPMLTETSLHESERSKYKGTDVLRNCSYFQEVLESFDTDIYLVRLLKLEAGGKIKFHTDEKVFKQRYDIIRCHIPIVTHPKCKFQLGYPVQRPSSGQDGIWNAEVLHSCFITPGYMWFTNVNALHSVDNGSDIDRVHLVIDLKPTREMLRRIYGI